MVQDNHKAMLQKNVKCLVVTYTSIWHNEEELTAHCAPLLHRKIPETHFLNMGRPHNCAVKL